MGVGSGGGVKREEEMGRRGGRVGEEVEEGGRVESESERQGGEKGREREWRERRIELEGDGGRRREWRREVERER